MNTRRPLPALPRCPLVGGAEVAASIKEADFRGPEDGLAANDTPSLR